MPCLCQEPIFVQFEPISLNKVPMSLKAKEVVAYHTSVVGWNSSFR